MFQTVDELTGCVLYKAEALKTKLDLQTDNMKSILKGKSKF